MNKLLEEFGGYLIDKNKAESIRRIYAVSA